MVLTFALVGLVRLTASSVTRIVFWRREVLTDVRDPGRAFGFCTIVASLDVVAVRLAAGGYPWAAAVFGAMGVPVWLILTYGVSTGLFLRSRDKPEPVRVDGSWLLWVVGTQALVIVTSVAVPAHPDDLLAGVAVGP